MKEDGVRVGVLDSTNANHGRRAHIRKALSGLECKVVVLECIVDDENVRNAIIAHENYLIFTCNLSSNLIITIRF